MHCRGWITRDLPRVCEGKVRSGGTLRAPRAMPGLCPGGTLSFPARLLGHWALLLGTGPMSTNTGTRCFRQVLCHSGTLCDTPAQHVCPAWLLPTVRGDRQEPGTDKEPPSAAHVLPHHPWQPCGAGVFCQSFPRHHPNTHPRIPHIFYPTGWRRNPLSPPGRPGRRKALPRGAAVHSPSPSTTKPRCSHCSLVSEGPCGAGQGWDPPAHPAQGQECVFLAQ